MALPHTKSAALALGASRLDAAFRPLKEWHEGLVSEEHRQAASVALALLRSDAAVDYLVSVVADASIGAAADAVEALATFRHDEALCERVRDTVDGRPEREVSKAFAEHFRL